MPGDLPEDVDDVLGRYFGGGVVELGWKFESDFPGVVDDALSHALAEAAEALVERSSSRCHSGTGRAVTVAQVRGSRGSSSVKRSSKLRAAASRWVRGSPRFQTFRRVEISEVWRYSSLNTEPCGTQGETRIAGTR